MKLWPGAPCVGIWFIVCFFLFLLPENNHIYILEGNILPSGIHTLRVQHLYVKATGVKRMSDGPTLDVKVDGASVCHDPINQVIYLVGGGTNRVDGKERLHLVSALHLKTKAWSSFPKLQKGRWWACTFILARILYITTGIQIILPIIHYWCCTCVHNNTCINNKTLLIPHLHSH